MAHKDEFLINGLIVEVWNMDGAECECCGEERYCVRLPARGWMERWGKVTLCAECLEKIAASLRRRA